MKDLNSLVGVNAAMLSALAERFLQDPRQVGEPWRGALAALPRESMEELVGAEAVAAWEARERVRRGEPNGHGNGHGADPRAAMGWQVAEQLRLAWSTQQLVDHYRRHGHTLAHFDPLRDAGGPGLRVDYRAFGITEADLSQPAQSDFPLAPGARVWDLIQALEETWCGAVGFEVMHIEDEAQRRWLVDRIERSRARAEGLDAARRKRVLARLTEASLLEQFIGRKFLGKKRFSLEGGELLLPMLYELIERCAERGVEEVILGMAHRGRLNVMINLLHQEPEELFAMFHDEDALEHLGSGDVKYHRGHSCDMPTPSGQVVHLSLCFNPSHLEFVNPVVLGRARGKQERLGDVEGRRVLPLQIHGDAAVVGQGVVPESLNLMGLEGYRTGGSVHVVINNQIGFTTLPDDSRTTRYCTDVARWFGCPVMHVHGERPEAALLGAQIAAEFRQQFGKDVFLDLVCYRLHGHNEGDEPRFTQPAMYRRIDAHKPPRDLYAAELIAAGVLTAGEDQAMIEEWTQHKEISLHNAHTRNGSLRPRSLTGAWEGYVGGKDGAVPEVETAVSEEALRSMLATLATPPEGFQIPRKLQRSFEDRLKMARGERPLDWAAAEALAFGTLLSEGRTIRISGQDSQRGTFTHRHTVVHDQDNYGRWVPLHAVMAPGGRLGVWNSPLSEAAVLGFDYGYSLDRPDALTIWEAQFGDFANGAQVIIDQFIVSGEDKWSRMSGVTLLLPHGYEGQGPEHSSARLERFLTMCAEDNIQVCNLTTPAQIFHALRRQVLRPLRKPLVIMSPKSLLRLPAASSALEELSAGGFQRIIADQGERDPGQVRRVLLCSGRLYYDLAAERERRGAQDIAILRVEQLYPICPQAIREALAPYPDARVFWVQDEPANMGAWVFVQARLRGAMGRNFPVDLISRAPSASPATGSTSSHNFEASRLLELAFGHRESDEAGAVVASEV
jgi:2-oxoglutarate dehydrogenase E1 component